MEITLRTAAALDSIRNVAAECPDMIVGVGRFVNHLLIAVQIQRLQILVVSFNFKAETCRKVLFVSNHKI